MMFNNIFNRFYHFSLYCFAFVVLTTAIIVTVVRLALPGIGGYRQQTQDWISQYMNYPVEISNIDADWNSWTPNLHLHNVSILDPVSNEEILNFKSVQISIDIFESLYKNKITPVSISISDLSLTLIRRRDGSITASKYLPDDYDDKQINNDAIAKWFLAQKNILVKRAQITLFDLNQNDEPILLSDATLRMRNNNYRTQIEGSALLPTSYGKILNFALDANGDVLTPDWSGEIYFEGKEIFISPLLTRIEDFGFKNLEGTGDIRIWTTWNGAKLRQLEGQLKLHELKFSDNQSEVYINKLTGNFSAFRRTDKGVELSLDLEELITTHGEWPETRFSLKKIYVSEHDEFRYIANTNYLKLDDINSFLNIFSGLSDIVPESKDFDFSGILHDSLIKYDPTLENDEQFYIDTGFSELGGHTNDYPYRLSGLSGRLQGTRKEGVAHIESSSAEFELGELLTDTLTFYELNTELNWLYDGSSLLVETESLEAHTQDFGLRSKGNLKFNTETGLPFLNLLVELSNAEIDTVVKYLPEAMPEKARNWFKRALVAGDIPSAEFVFRGRLEDYPFRNHEGVFQGYAEASLETLDYHPLWPPADGINAGIMARGDTVTVDIQSGYFFDAEITKASVIIKDLATRGSKKSIALNGNINGHVKDGLLFVADSPLKTTPALKNLPSRNFTGGMGIDLAMQIPLFPGQILFDGSLTLRDATFARDDIKIELTDLNGRIDFSRGFVSAEGMKANFFNTPVELAISSRDGFPSRTTLSGTADNQFISAQLLRYFPSLAPYKSEIEKRINGSCLWQVSQINTEPKTGLKINQQLILTSSLTGLSIDAPVPLAKSDRPAAFKLSIRYPEVDKREITLHYAHVLNGLFHVNDTNAQKSVTTSLSFGDKATIADGDDQFSISGQVEHLVAGEWIKFITDISSIERPEAQKKDVSLDVQTASLEFGHQNFSNVNLKLKNIDTGYHLNLNAENIDGEIFFNHLSAEDPVNINLRKLILTKNETEDSVKKDKSEILPETIPPLNIKISELIYNDIELGQMNLVTSKIDKGMSVDNINFNKTDMTINGTGFWNIVDNEHNSRFNLSLNAASMKTMLETFNYDVAAIEKGETNLSLDAQWQGTPIDFSLDNLNGTLLMEIDKGRFTDIDPSAGRLFGLLSLQTLPRRLSLDFSDLFGKGLAFDNIEGHFNIENGNAYTNNMTMTGPSVNINISGRTGLIDQDYDQIATITPKITDSLPVASALFGPIGIGIGAVIFLASEIFSSLPEKIDTLLRKQYTITGAWDDPLVTKIKQNEERKDNG